MRSFQKVFSKMCIFQGHLAPARNLGIFRALKSISEYFGEISKKRFRQAYLSSLH